MFKFKTEKPTGAYRSFYPNINHIKLGKFKVGTIMDEKPYKINLMVYKNERIDDGNPNCDWMWIRLKIENETLDDAKKWLNQNYDVIVKQYKLYESKD